MRFFWHSLKQCIWHWIRAKKRHGVHSPLIYGLTDRDLCVALPGALDKIKTYRSEMMQSKETWTVKDFGAGSRTVTKHLGNAVSKATSNFHKGSFLFRWSQRFQPQYILELGTHVGIGSAYLLEGSPSAILHSIEGDPFLQNKANQWLSAYGERSQLYCGSFQSQLDDVVALHKWDLVVIDGHHHGEAMLNYFTKILPHLNEDAWVIFDDIHWSPDMTEAWNRIVKDDSNLLTLDFYHWGLMRNSKRFQKEHFVLRY